MAKRSEASVHNIEDNRKKSAKGPEPQFDANGRIRLPPLPRAGKKQKPQKPCECGCGEMTRSRFAPGHDSYLRGWVLRVEREIVKIGEVPEQHQAAVRKALKERKQEGKQQQEASSASAEA